MSLPVFLLLASTRYGQSESPLGIEHDAAAALASGDSATPEAAPRSRRPSPARRLHGMLYAAGPLLMLLVTLARLIKTVARLRCGGPGVWMMACYTCRLRALPASVTTARCLP
jgi:hypothetical protein